MANYHCINFLILPEALCNKIMTFREPKKKMKFIHSVTIFCSISEYPNDNKLQQSPLIFRSSKTKYASKFLESKYLLSS